MMKNLIYGTLFIIFIVFGSSVSAQNCPKDPLPVSRKLDRVLTHAENEMEMGHHQKALHVLADYTRTNPPDAHPQRLEAQGIYPGIDPEFQ